MQNIFSFGTERGLDRDRLVTLVSPTTIAAVIVSIVYFIIYTIVFDASVRGLGDAYRGIAQLSRFDLLNFSIKDEVFARFVLAVLSGVLLGALVVTKLIPIQTFQFFLIWPYSIYLITKIKLEFFYFVLCQVRTDLHIKTELAFLGGLGFLYFYFNENNFLILIVYRLFLVLYSRYEIKTVWFLTTFSILFFVALDSNIDLLFGIFPKLMVFDYTRDYVNPEYSIIETIAVFISSMHLSVWVQTDWVFHIFFSLVIIFLVVFDKKSLTLILNDVRLPAIITTILLFTSLTHAFQNARYYYFYLPLLCVVLSNRTAVVAALGLAHAFFMAFVYVLTV